MVYTQKNFTNKLFSTKHKGNVYCFIIYFKSIKNCSREPVHQLTKFSNLYHNFTKQDKNVNHVVMTTCKPLPVGVSPPGRTGGSGRPSPSDTPPSWGTPPLECSPETGKHTRKCNLHLDETKLSYVLFLGHTTDLGNFTATM